MTITNRVAKRRLVCAACGETIQIGERYRKSHYGGYVGERRPNGTRHRMVNHCLREGCGVPIKTHDGFPDGAYDGFTLDETV